MSQHIYVAAVEVEHDVDPVHNGATYDLLYAATKRYAARYGMNVSNNFWGDGGARFYLDANKKVEGATGVGLDGTIVATHEIGLSLFWALMAAYADRDLRQKPTAMVLKTNTGHNGDSTGGRHINISMPLCGSTFAAQVQKAADFEKAFIVTWQVIGGAGVVLPRGRATSVLGGYDWDFGIGARGYHVGCVGQKSAANNVTPDGDKPVIIARGEPHADSDEFWRKQVCGMDSNILFAPIQLGIDLLLILSEMTVAEAYEPLQLIEHKAEMSASRQVSLNWRAPLETSKGTMTPLEVQWFYWRQMWTYVTTVRRGRGLEHMIEWARRLTLFHTEEDFPREAFGVVDWVTKLVMLMRRDARDGYYLKYWRAEEYHLAYNGFRFRRGALGKPANLCMPLRLLDQFGPPGLLSRAWWSLHEPPPDTRAVAMSRIVKLRLPMALVNWGEWRVDGIAGSTKIPDPAMASTPAFDDMLDLAVQRDAAKREAERIDREKKAADEAAEVADAA
jgi:hypothetical protein